MQQLNLTLTSAWLLAMYATPIELVPAPGAGRILVPIAFAARLNFNTVPYVGNKDISLVLGNPANGIRCMAISFDLIGAAAHTSASGPLLQWPRVTDVLANIENVALNLQTDSAELTAGNSTIDLTIFYGTAKIQ